MVYNRYKCDNEVKEHFKDHYINCTTNKSSKKTPKTASGSYLNQFIYFRPFKTSKKYQICNNLYHTIEQKRLQPLSNDERKAHNNSTIHNLIRESTMPVFSLPDFNNDTILLVSDRQARVEQRNLMRLPNDVEKNEE